MTKKWPPLDPGTRVRTTSKKTADKEWMPEALVARKWGMTGTIIMHHDSHGLCYDVRHDDGTEGCYDPPEFDVLPEPKDSFLEYLEKNCPGDDAHSGYGDKKPLLDRCGLCSDIYEAHLASLEEWLSKRLKDVKARFNL